MDLVTRRRFLLASGVVGASALAAGAGAIGMAELLRSVPAERPEWLSRKVNRVVLVTLYGGNDGLNTVIPYADSAYHTARPDLAYQPEQVLHLDKVLGLNPGMRGLKRLWDAKQLAIVLGVGYPKPDRSHFRSMDIWQTASPTRVANTGWVGRWLDGMNAPRETAVSFEQVLPPMFVGRTRSGSCVSDHGLALPTWVDEKTIIGLGRSDPQEPEMQRLAAAACADLIKLGGVLRGSQGQSSPGAGASAPPVTGTGGHGVLDTQLTQVVRCIEAGVPIRVFSVSEFGRRVRANGSDGTDHGTAGPVFVMGPRVAGGFYGAQPSLADLDDGDLKATTDFRDVFGTVLETVLEAEPARYLDGYQPRGLPLFTPG